MTAPSYNGPTVVAICKECGTLQEIPDPERFGVTDEIQPGGCEGCSGGENGTQLTEKEIWDGPVTLIDG